MERAPGLGSRVSRARGCVVTTRNPPPLLNDVTRGTAAEFVEREALKPEEQSEAVKLLAEVLPDAIPTPPGVSPIAEALLEEVLEAEPGEANRTVEDFADNDLEQYLEEIKAYEDIHGDSDALGSVRGGIEETHREYQEDLDG